MRTEAGSFGTRDVAVRASGGSDKAHLAVSYHWRDTRRLQHRAARRRERRLARSARFTLRGGAKLLPGVTLDFTVRHSEKTADRDGFGDFAAPAGTLATAFDDRSTLGNRVLLAGANLRWDMLDGALTQEFRANHNGTVTSDTDRTFFSRPARTPARPTSSPISPPIASTRRRLWAKHSFSGRVEKEDERFTPEGDLRRRPTARARPHRLYGRVARRLRRPAVPHRRHPPRRQRQLPGLHDLARGRLAGAARDQHAAACQRRHGGEAAHHVRAVRHRSSSSCPTPI